MLGQRLGSVRAFSSTAAAELRRPWKTYKDGTLFYGYSKNGNKRLALTTKQGNKNFYKGTRSTGIGKMDQWGGYHIKYEKVRTFVVPEALETCTFKPLVSANAPVPKNSFKGYTGITDGKLHLAKIKEFVETGKASYEVTDTYVEKY